MPGIYPYRIDVSLIAISRAGVAWYEFSYGRDFTPDTVTELQFIVQCLFALLTPAASIGYLIIFISLQPKAYDALKALLTCQPVTPSTKTSAPKQKRISAVVTRNSTAYKINENDMDKKLAPYAQNLNINERISLTYETRMTMNDYTDEELVQIIDFGYSESEVYITGGSQGDRSGRASSRDIWTMDPMLDSEGNVGNPIHHSNESF